MNRDNTPREPVPVLSALSDISSVGGFLIALIPGIIGFFSGIKWLFIIAAVFVIIAVVILVILKKSTKISETLLKKIFNLSCPASDYTISNKTIIYEYESRDKISLSKIFNIIIKRNGVEGVEDKYSWTGKAALTPVASYSNTEIRMLDNRYGMQRYMIALKDGRRLCKGEHDVKFAMIIPDIDDSKHESSSHLSTGIYEITDHIELKVVFPLNLKVSNVRFLEYLHYTDDNYYKSYEPNIIINNETSKRELIFDMKNPFMGGRYVIDWTFDGE